MSDDIQKTPVQGNLDQTLKNLTLDLVKYAIMNELTMVFVVARNKNGEVFNVMSGNNAVIQETIDSILRPHLDRLSLAFKTSPGPGQAQATETQNEAPSTTIKGKLN